MEKKHTVKRACLGSGRLPVIRDYPELLKNNNGNPIHECPVCRKSWSRNTLQDWSALPVPNHRVDVDPHQARRPGDGVAPGRYASNRIEDWSDERSSGSGIIVTLKYGFTFEGGQHIGVKGFDSGAQAGAAVKASDHCYCDDCVAKLPKIKNGKEIYRG